MNRKTKRIAKICVIVLCAVIIGCIYVSSLFGEKDLYLEYVGTKTRGGTTYVNIDVENNTGSKISLGWVNSCSVFVTTDEGIYEYTPHMKEIGRSDNSLSVPVVGLEGEIKKIKITEHCLLNDSGLPETKMRDIVVYDAEGYADGFSGNFPFFNFGKIIKTIAPFFGVILLIIGVLQFVMTLKSFGRGIIRKFKPGFADSISNNLFHQQHEDFMRTSMDMHNQAVQHHIQATNNFNEHFAHQSVSFINEGGFIPPPCDF